MGDAVVKSVRGRPLEADGAKTRQKIIAGARECFAVNGYANATNKLIAESAGVTASNIYNYFPAKRDIYMAIVEEGEHYIAEVYEKAAAAEASPRAAMMAIFDSNIAIFEQRPDLPPFFGHLRTEVARHPELVELMADRQSMIRPILGRLVSEAQRQGEISTKVAVENIEMMLFACILGLSMFGLQTDKDTHINNMLAFKALLSGNLMQPDD